MPPSPLPTQSVQPGHQLRQGQGTARLLAGNGAVLLAAGLLAAALPGVLEGSHPHRRGQEHFQEQVRVGGLVGALAGALYLGAGLWNLQAWYYQLGIDRLLVAAVLALCWQIGQLHGVELAAFLALDTCPAVAFLALHQRDHRLLARQRKRR